jgi:hypothetical protein
VDGIFRPQLVVVSDLFLHDGIQAITKPFSRTFFSRWDSGYHKAFLTNFFLFSRWDSGYHKAFLTNFFFFHDGILAITKPFSRTFFFFHDGILAITNPFSRTFFFTMGFWLSQSLSHELFFFFHDGILAITKPFSRTFFFFHDGILEIRDLGEDSFYTYITKSIYIGSASLKTLPLYLEPPL